MPILTDEIKSLIENSIVAFSTVNEEGKPHSICVAFPKVVGEDLILIKDSFMEETVKNIRANKHVSLLVWSTGWKDIKDCVGYELRGVAEYFDEGKWVELLKKEKRGVPVKGAILVKIEEIKKLK